MVLVKEQCPFCQGSGVRIVETSSLFGLFKRHVPTSCDQCSGAGFRVTLPLCEFCEGQGLVGNERDICRACNGTGRIDAFGFIPRYKLKAGLLFERRCDQCGDRTFEIISEIEQKKLSRTWEREEELRQVEIVEQVKVRCSSCGQTYYVAVDPALHQDLADDVVRDLENIGVNLSFMYQRS